GGQNNVASGDTSTVAGGYANTASGSHAAVPGGESNAATGIDSFAGGKRAKATHEGSFVWSDFHSFDFGSNGDSTFNVRATGGARFVSACDCGVSGTGAATAGVSLASGTGSW